MSLKQVMALREKVDRLRSAAERAKGAADTIRKTLSDKWKCGTLSDARTMLKGMEAEGEKLRLSFVADLAKFEEKWADELEAAG